MRFHPYSCGSINPIGRVAMTASIDITVAQLVLAMVASSIPYYAIERWRNFPSYQALNVITLAYNLVALKRAPWTHNVGCKSYLVMMCICLSMNDDLTHRQYQLQSSYHWHRSL